MNKASWAIMISLLSCKSMRSTLSSQLETPPTLDCKEQVLRAGESQQPEPFFVQWGSLSMIVARDGVFSVYAEDSDVPLRVAKLEFPEGYAQSRFIDARIMRRRHLEERDTLMIVYKSGILFFKETQGVLRPTNSQFERDDLSLVRSSDWRIVGSIGGPARAGSLIPATQIEAYGFDPLYQTVVYTLKGSQELFIAGIQESAVIQRTFMTLDQQRPAVDAWRRHARYSTNFTADAIQSLRSPFQWPGSWRPKGRIFIDHHGQMIVTENGLTQVLCLRFDSGKDPRFGPHSLGCQSLPVSVDHQFVGASLPMESFAPDHNQTQKTGVLYRALFSAYKKPGQNQGVFYAIDRDGVMTRQMPQVEKIKTDAIDPRGQIRDPLAEAGHLHEFAIAKQFLSQSIPGDRFLCPPDRCVASPTTNGVQTIRFEDQSWNLTRYRRDDGVAPYLFELDLQRWPASSTPLEILPHARGWSYRFAVQQKHELGIGSCTIQGNRS